MFISSYLFLSVSSDSGDEYRNIIQKPHNAMETHVSNKTRCLNKSNKLVTLLKVAASAVSGQQMDIGREGDLEL